MQTTNIRRPSRSRSRRARTTQRGRNATSASRPCIHAREKASCVVARVEIVTAFLLQNWASCTCRAWRSRPRFWSRRPMSTIWETRRRMLGGFGGIRAACASRTIMVSWRAHSAGRAGGRTWAGRRGTGLGAYRLRYLGTNYPMQDTLRTRCPCKRPSCLCSGALGPQQPPCSPCRVILRARIKGLDGPKPCRCGEMYTLDI